MSYKNLLKVVYETDPSSVDVARLEAIYALGEPIGEYFYYAEAYKKMITPDGLIGLYETNGYIHRIEFAVKVYFEQDVKSEAIDSIREAKEKWKKSGSQFMSETYPRIKEHFSRSVHNAILNGDGYQEAMSPLWVGDNEAATVRFSRNDHRSSKVQFLYTRVDDERTTEIVGIESNTDVSVEEVYNHWLLLVERYKNLPMAKFTYANRL